MEPGAKSKRFKNNEIEKLSCQIKKLKQNKLGNTGYSRKSIDCFNSFCNCGVNYGAVGSSHNRNSMRV